MDHLLKNIRRCLVLFFLTVGFNASAQIIYAVGANTNPATIDGYNGLYTIDPGTGAATAVAGCTLGGGSTGNAVSNVNGLVYYITRESTPTGVIAGLRTIDPVTCTDTAVGGSLPPGLTSTLRMTFCPDGRLYASGNVANFWEINTSTGNAARTLTWTNIPSINTGSGDIACLPNGDLYIAALPAGTTTYQIYSSASANFQLVPTGSGVNFNTVGSVILPLNTMSGLALGPTGTGCAASPNPCFYASTGNNSQTWRINVLTGVATQTSNATGAVITDLGSAYPVDLSTSKSVSPTSALPGQTVVYTIIVTNNGPGVSRAIRVTDTLPSGLNAGSVWACGVNAAGSGSTLVTTSCGTASGTGNPSTTLALSISGSIIITVTGTISNSATTTLTNVAQATLTTPVVSDLTPTNNIATATTTVTPAAFLQVTKTNGTTTSAAGTTVNYTLTFTNLGPSVANGAVIKDQASTGLSNCSVTSCNTAGNPTAATCPGAPNGIFTGAGVAVPSFPSSSSVTLVVSCGVSATGL